MTNLLDEATCEFPIGQCDCEHYPKEEGIGMFTPLELFVQCPGTGEMRSAIVRLTEPEMK
jgi:hypothetical protein